MAHFAKLDENNIVIDVNVVNNDVINNLPFPESEPVGVAFLTEWSNGYTNWKQTSFNKSFRNIFAGIGFHYTPVGNAFYEPRPYDKNGVLCNSWTLDENKWIWMPPAPKPDSGIYHWNEPTQQWVIEPTLPSGTIDSTIL